VTAVSTRLGHRSVAFIATWIITCIAVCMISALVKPGDQTDAVPILIWTGIGSAVVAFMAGYWAHIARGPLPSHPPRRDLRSSPRA
jgi:hypothetical protein